MAEQELDLLQLSADGVAQLRARAPQVMWRDGPEAEFDSVLFHDAVLLSLLQCAMSE